MSQHDPKTSLRHMLDATRESIQIAADLSREDLNKNRIANLALTRLLEILGEAANRIPKEERDKLPSIPWEPIIGMRNRLIHGYDQVDLDILWEVINTDLPQLLIALEPVV